MNTSIPSSRCTAARRGLTLVEAAISTVIVAVVVVAGLRAVAGATRARMIAKDLSRGPQLASVLMGEIVQNAYQEPDSTNPPLGLDGPESGASRADWDDVDDYNGFSQTTLTYKDETSIADCKGWKWQSRVALVSPGSPNTVSGSDQGLKRITVTVTEPSGRVTTLVALRSKISLYDQQPTSRITYLQQMNMTLRVGGDSGATISGGTNLLNRIPVE